MSITRIGVCTLNQFSMDFQYNLENILESIRICKKKECLYRLGPELEVCGYMCEDHFLEYDTVTHCWEVLVEILKETDGIVCDIGMPVIHKNVFYNCRLICFNRKIHLIRPKQYLADDGNYRESRWFTPWSKEIEEFELPLFIQKITGQTTIPIGIAIVKTEDTEIGYEICEELWVPQPTSTSQALDGAEIIVNASSSYFQCGKIIQRTDLFKDVTKRNGACYAFCNMRGCDGNRLYFDGSSMIAQNGMIFASSEVFSLHDVEVTTCDIDLNEIRIQRINQKSRSLQASKSKHFPRVKLDVNLTQQHKYIYYKDIQINYPNELQDSISCYLWDYLRRSGAMGFMLPLSGGLDSCATALCVFHMCVKIYKTIQTKDEFGTYQKVLQQLRKIVQDDNFTPKNAEEIVNRIFYTAYLGTSNSSLDTRQKAKTISNNINSKHYEVEMDNICAAFTQAIKPIFNQEPQFQLHGGTLAEDLALQNIQARTRMVLTYLIAQLMPWNNKKQGFLIVLGSSNLDESLRGYLTKYDCSSADINPIGSLSKNNLRKLIQDTHDTYGFPILIDILDAKPSAELKPSNEVQKQVSELEMELSFDELETFGRLRKSRKLGPVGMFKKLTHIWTDILTPHQVAEKVKKFFTFYSINRHKTITLTASYHAMDHSCDDNRYDFRQIIYNWRWPWQFKKIDELLQ